MRIEGRVIVIVLTRPFAQPISEGIFPAILGASSDHMIATFVGPQKRSAWDRARFTPAASQHFKNVVKSRQKSTL